MKEFIKNQKWQIAFAAAGALGGFLYWKLIGCTSGTCPIKSVWYWSTLWGTAVGYLAGDLIYDILKKRRKKKEGKSEHKISEHN